MKGSLASRSCGSRPAIRSGANTTSGGFVDVKQNHVVLLAETAEHSTEIDKARAEASKDRAQKRLAEHKSEVDATRAQASLQRALNRLKIARSA